MFGSIVSGLEVKAGKITTPSFFSQTIELLCSGSLVFFAVAQFPKSSLASLVGPTSGQTAKSTFRNLVFQKRKKVFGKSRETKILQRGSVTAWKVVGLYLGELRLFNTSRSRQVDLRRQKNVATEKLCNLLNWKKKSILTSVTFFYALFQV